MSTACVSACAEVQSDADSGNDDNGEVERLLSLLADMDGQLLRLQSTAARSLPPSHWRTQDAQEATYPPWKRGIASGNSESCEYAVMDAAVRSLSPGPLYVVE